MKGVDKLTSIRLAEVLSQKGVMPAETITDALYVQDKQGEPFVEVLVSGGHIAEWDLARVVVENFQLPFILAGNYDVSEEAKTCVQQEELFAAMLVPLDLFGDVLTVSMPVMTSSKVLRAIAKKYKLDIFPYVGLISENKKVMSDTYPEFKGWLKERRRKKEHEMTERKKHEAQETASPNVEGGWADMFDSADAAVQDSLHKKKQ